MIRVLKEAKKDIHRLKKQCKNLKIQLLNKRSGKGYKTTTLQYVTKSDIWKRQ